MKSPVAEQAWRASVLNMLVSPAVLLLAGVLGSGLLLAYWVQSIGGPQAIHEQFGMLAPLLTLGLQVFLAPTPFPSDVICIVNGTLYGFWFAVVLNWMGWWVGALLAFWLGRRVRTDFALERYLSRLPSWLRRFPVGHPVYLIGVRQIPWAGGHLTTFVPGAMGVPLMRQAWCAGLAIIPGSVTTAAIGAGLLML